MGVKRELQERGSEQELPGDSSRSRVEGRNEDAADDRSVGEKSEGDDGRTRAKALPENKDRDEASTDDEHGQRLRRRPGGPLGVGEGDGDQEETKAGNEEEKTAEGQWETSSDKSWRRAGKTLR